MSDFDLAKYIAEYPPIEYESCMLIQLRMKECIREMSEHIYDECITRGQKGFVMSVYVEFENEQKLIDRKYIDLEGIV